ncbi:MAG TPA: BlaI/MecI/CopY family transcriptional regulator [Longimicrobium sp.]|nr:BlaI/MecI/CopY family transcriptional regulator [Longimicrobium sp.]
MSERESPAMAGLSRRERQIMEVVYAAGRATAAQVHERIPDAPTATAVRTLLRILEAKGHLRHVKDGNRHVYLPTTPRATAQKSALRDLLRTFFGGSRRAAVAALLELDDPDLSPDERAELARMIAEAEARGQ